MITFRFVLAWLAAALLLPTAMLCLVLLLVADRRSASQLHDIARNVGPATLIHGAIVITLGAAILIFLRRQGRLNSLSVIGGAMLVAAVLVPAVELVLFGLSGMRGPSSPDAIFVVVALIGVGVALMTSAAFCGVAGIPWRGAWNPVDAVADARAWPTRAALGLTTVAVAASIGVIGFMPLTVVFGGSIPMPFWDWAIDPAVGDWSPPDGAVEGFVVGQPRANALIAACRGVQAGALQPIDFDCSRRGPSVYAGGFRRHSWRDEEVWLFQLHRPWWDRPCLGLEGVRLAVVVTREAVSSLHADCGYIIR